MTEPFVRSLLRILGVLLVLTGLILATTTLLTWFGASRAMSSAPLGMSVKMTGMTGELGFYAVLAYVLVSVWGLLLCGASAGLARRIVA